MNGPRPRLVSLPRSHSTPPVLPSQALPVVRMAVPDAADPDSGDEVDVLLSVFVHQRRAAPPGHGEPRVEREGLEPRRHMLLLPRHDAAPPGTRGARLP